MRILTRGDLDGLTSCVLLTLVEKIEQFLELVELRFLVVFGNHARGARQGGERSLEIAPA